MSTVSYTEIDRSHNFLPARNITDRETILAIVTLIEIKITDTPEQKKRHTNLAATSTVAPSTLRDRIHCY
jgi:hypothetical protein